MKRTFIGICFLILMTMLVACGSDFTNTSSSTYSNFTAKGNGDTYEISGKSKVVNALPLAYISALEDTSVDLSGELKYISGDIQIVSIDPYNMETVIFDSGKDSKKDLKLNTTVTLQKGENCLEFRGTESTFKFNLLFTNINEDKIEYFSADTEDNEFDSINFEDTDMESEGNDIHNTNNDKLLNEISVTYTDKADNCIILDTSLNKDTKIKVLVDANVNPIEDKDETSFDGFHLAYQTEDRNTVKVLKYKTNEYAMGGYEWQDGFAQEIQLPKGTSQLIFHNYNGKNYEIHLNIQVFAVD